MIPEKNVEYLQAEVDKDVQAVYVKLFGDNPDFVQYQGYDNIHKAWRLNRQTGVKQMINGRMKDAVQDGYLYYIGSHNVRHATLMKDFTGIGPVMDGQMKECVDCGYGGLFEIARLDPDRYEKLLCIDEAKELKRLVGIGPSEALLKQYPEFAEALK